MISNKQLNDKLEILERNQHCNTVCNVTSLPTVKKTTFITFNGSLYFWDKDSNSYVQLVSGGSNFSSIQFVNNFNSLPAASAHTGEGYYASNAQGTNTPSWIPGWVGGTYYPAGLYISDGTDWRYGGDVLLSATQAEVDAGTSGTVFVTPTTLANSELIASKEDKFVTKIAGENIPSYSAIAVIGNQAFRYDNRNPAHQYAFYGFATNSPNTGQDCIIKITGELTLALWGLTQNTHYMVGNAGNLVTTVSTPGEYRRIVAYATTSDTIRIISDYDPVLII